MPYKTPPRYGDALGLRERQVIEGIARGLTNPKIAAEMGIATDTVKHYARVAFVKLGASTRAEAALIAYRRGVLRRDCPTCGRPVERAASSAPVRAAVPSGVPGPRVVPAGPPAGSTARRTGAQR